MLGPTSKCTVKNRQSRLYTGQMPFHTVLLQISGDNKRPLIACPLSLFSNGIKLKLESNQTILQLQFYSFVSHSNHSPSGRGRRCCFDADIQARKLSPRRRTEFCPRETHGLLRDDRTAHHHWHTPWRSRGGPESGMSTSDAAMHSIIN